MIPKPLRGFTTKRAEWQSDSYRICPRQVPGANPSLRGFTLLIAVILSSVVITVGVSLLDVAYKQVVLAQSAKQSQYAFYAADSAMECALYWDQKFDAFDYNAAARAAYTTITCGGQNITPAHDDSGSTHLTTFSVPCAGGGSSADVSIYRQSSGSATIYTNGYNNCNASDTRRIDRGLKVFY